MRATRPAALLWIGFLSTVCFGATSAQALGISPNPADILAYGTDVIARVTSSGSVTGTPAGGIVLNGTVAPTDTTLLFTVEHLAPSVGPLGIFQIYCTGCAWSAVGWIPGANENWGSGFRSGLSATAVSGSLDTGLVSDVVFVSLPSITVGTVLDLYFTGYHGVPSGIGTATVVPEPATLGLLGTGLAAIASRRRS